MVSRSAEANAAIVFGYLGGAQLVSAPFICFYLMPYWLYFRTVFPVSFPFGITALLGASLLLQNKPLTGAALLLASSLASGVATLLFAVGIVDPLVGALFAGIAGVLAIYAARSRPQ
jgi:hypothetical protein